MAKDFNSQHVVDGYDVHIRKLIPGYEVVHQQIQALLKTYVNEHAHVLIVGCGTGYELGYLLQLFPNWSFTATDLSATMLDKAKHYIQPLDAMHRVEFVLADVDQLKTDSIYDAALSILVTHFVPYAHKPEFFKAIVSRLKQHGVFIGFDLTEMNTDQERGMLQHICEANGLSTAQSTAMLNRLADDFYPLSEQETFEQLSLAGFGSVQRFTQILSYQGFMALKV
ncbi:SAM-dependent methyltransferase [Acinetobacter sp. ANC 4654]|uniref:class I SAM-dependent methyltransferase n=1 Tax=Acinetobacter sp. ANC 4654 TaxID=1977872 RepID=UPI000A35958B|nr:class I SAM-dependent methyltransferase [Acinetobacter sp. ANC 4654]OTG95157.1 SAM-dependent methyltransferase [Acinetobacter sp. ANC 4654]